MTARIQCTKNGPLIVEGVDQLTRYGSETSYDAKNRMALCRCGKSSSKPFCDGSHVKIGFDDSRQDGRTPDRRVDYAGKRVTIHDNRGICAHAGICTERLAGVFRYGQEPWIDPDGASVEEIDAIVRACPSGAISYSIDGSERPPNYPGKPRISVAPGGPYAVQGSIELEGIEWAQGARRDCFVLCRCGQSRNKPFCDGSHWDTEFDEDAQAG